MNNLQNKDLWKFSSITSIEEYNFNRALEKFYKLGVSGLVRENIQNSLDAKLVGNTNPVFVKINTGKVDTKYIPGIEEIRNRISCIEGKNAETKGTIVHMKKKMNQAEIDYISFEDSNTRGLKGAKNGQSNCKEDTWGIYAYNKGFHLEEDDEDMEKYRGGSHGIGKIASNSASELFITYFANCDEYGDKHLGGTVQLIEHEYKGDYYRSTGYFTDVENISGNKTKFYPYRNNFHEIFQKDTRGLKIIIPFLREQFNDEKKIIKSICDSFFIAIIENKLEVVVNNEVINKETIKDYILNEKYYLQDISEMKKEFTPLYFQTYSEKEPILLIIEDKKQEYKFKLYFNYDERIAKGRVAIIRTIGMKIEDKKIKSNVNKPFNGVMVPNSVKEDAFLKSLENESHTELSFEHIKDQQLQKNAKRFINNISREIAKIIEDAIKSNNPTDGVMDTKDILYIVENQFRKDLSNSVETVKINKGEKPKTIVKVIPTIPKKKKKKDSGKGKNKGYKKKRTLRKVEKGPEDKYSDKGKKIKYTTRPDMVNRLILGEKEILKFDFSGRKEFKDIDSCNISLAVVDGMGKEYLNEFDMKDNYKDAIDKLSGKRCKIDNNIIKDIKIKNDIAQIELKLNEECNKSLKFIYYVEV